MDNIVNGEPVFHKCDDMCGEDQVYIYNDECENAAEIALSNLGVKFKFDFDPTRPEKTVKNHCILVDNLNSFSKKWDLVVREAEDFLRE